MWGFAGYVLHTILLSSGYLSNYLSGLGQPVAYYYNVVPEIANE